VGDVLTHRVGIVRAFLDAFARRDEGRLLSLLAPDAQFSTRVHVLPELQFTGRDAVGARFRVVDEEYDRFEVLDASYRQGAGDAVLVTCRLSLRFKGERFGQARESNWLFRVDEERGQVSSIRSYRDPGDAMRAAGLTSGTAFSSEGA
jgi:ketosteroid isomerase-like protein